MSSLCSPHQLFVRGTPSWPLTCLLPLLAQSTNLHHVHCSNNPKLHPTSPPNPPWSFPALSPLQPCNLMIPAAHNVWSGTQTHLESSGLHVSTFICFHTCFHFVVHFH